jgi:hypothetical protein
MMKIVSRIIALLTAAAVSVVCFSEFAATVKIQAEKKLSVVKLPSKNALHIRGFQPGMTMSEVKQLLRKKKIYAYETAFSDLFAFEPDPGSEMKLEFACSSKGPILAKVRLFVSFTAEETGMVLPKLKQKLIERYGMPRIRESQSNMFDFCWGRCGQEQSGLKLEAATTALPQGNNRSLVLMLQNGEMLQACKDIRIRRINGWLRRWVDDVMRFKPGLPLKQAAAFYQRRYREKMAPAGERDNGPGQFGVRGYTVKEHDFFDGLDYDSLAFEGSGPGDIILKFTGDQTGNGTGNSRLYYSFFSTTKFAQGYAYGAVRPMLERFIKVLGTPTEVSTCQDGVMAVWQHDTRKMTAVIHDSGLITFEQSDSSLQESYNEAAVKMREGLNKNRFEGSLF